MDPEKSLAHYTRVGYAPDDLADALMRGHTPAEINAALDAAAEVPP